MRHQWGILLALLLLAGSVTGQTLSDIVLPSEEEVLEAFYNGDITYEQLVVLREVIATGIDSTTLYLLDEIPNLLYVAGQETLPDQTELEQSLLVEENRPPPRTARDLSIDWRHRFSQELDDEERCWYRDRLDLRWRTEWRLRTQMERTQSGRERVTYRTLLYRPQRRFVKRLELGSYSTRIGLGTAFGYRGKLLDYARELNRESLAYPD